MQRLVSGRSADSSSAVIGRKTQCIPSLLLQWKKCPISFKSQPFHLSHPFSYSQGCSSCHISPHKYVLMLSIFKKRSFPTFYLPLHFLPSVLSRPFWLGFYSHLATEVGLSVINDLRLSMVPASYFSSVCTPQLSSSTIHTWMTVRCLSPRHVPLAPVPHAISSSISAPVSVESVPPLDRKLKINLGKTKLYSCWTPTPPLPYLTTWHCHPQFLRPEIQDPFLFLFSYLTSKPSFKSLPPKELQVY